MRLFLYVLVFAGCLLPGSKGAAFCTVYDDTPLFSAPDLGSTVVTLVERNTCFYGEMEGEWLVLQDNPVYYIHGYTIIEDIDSAADINEDKGEGTWTQWDSWSECDTVECNVVATRNRTRTCFVLNPNIQAHCNGDESIQQQTCSKNCFVPCSDGFGWTTWQDCKTCSGTTMRSGYCVNGTGNFTRTEFTNCTQDLCPKNGTWSTWGPWGACSKTDGQLGITVRYRQCLPAKRHGGADCPGDDFVFTTCVAIPWEEWSPWSSCTNINCTDSVSIRIRSCKENRICSSGSDSEQKICYPEGCKFDGVWGAWQDWSLCYCNGFRKRYRQCDSPPPLNGGKECVDINVNVGVCNRTRITTECPEDGKWTGWSTWSPCSVSCGTERDPVTGTVLTRLLLLGGLDCGPDNLSVENCTSSPCPVAGGWSTWSYWSSCSATCQATGLEQRNRSCDRPPPDNGGQNCTGDEGDLRICTGSGACPVDGGYSDWLLWNACSVSCSGGVRYRTRNCNQPKPQAGGSDCSILGKSTEASTCNLQSCPVDGYWGMWSNWSRCDVTCGDGTRARDRQCLGTANGGQNCSGDALRTEACNSVICPVDGAWGQWANWSVCNCNNTQTRVRKCDSPAPIGSGQHCQGSSRDTMSCTDKPTTCPVDGQWGSWYPWGVCSKTCGLDGDMSRLRLCNNPRPGNGGLYCDVHEKGEEEHMVCQGPPCPIDGSWSGWSSWSACDVTCATGTRDRARTCDSPAPQHGGQPCNGTADQFEQCQQKPCPVDGMWGAWQKWTSCSVTCLNGTRARTRLCDSPAPQYGGSDCAGQQNGTDTCTPRDNCDVDGGWSEWSPWSVCDATCANGQHVRYRNCENPRPQNFGNFCEGDDNDVATCFVKPCPIDGGFGSWLAWGSCSPPTGNGLKTRTRLCDKPQPQYGGRNCQGIYTENLSCCDSYCPVDGGWSDWSAWSDCPADSNTNTTKSRTRNCSQPVPLYAGDNCTGESVESTCCQVNGGWTSWYAWSICVGDCATAHRDRNRLCVSPKPSCGGKYCVGMRLELDYTCIPDNCTTIATAATITATSARTPDTSAAATTAKHSSTSPPHVTAGTTAASTAHPNHQIACTFDVRLNCAWHNVEILDDMDWIVFNGSTQTDDTGPSSDHTYGNTTGKYIYLESSAPSRECDKAWYQSAVIQPGVNAPVCFQFWYHMYGADTGSLNIYMASGPQLPGQLLWTVSGNQGDVWMYGHVPLSFTSNFSIIAEATVGNGFRGDIGLDDLMFTQATCSLYPSTAHTQSTATCSATTISPYTGTWSAWFNGQCSVTCGNGTLTRVRHCSTGHAEDCAGNSIEVAHCKKPPCTVNGVWSLWSPWSQCDVTCEDGQIHRTRTCTDPAPAFGGLNCSGVNQETSTCSRAKCPVWSAWFNGQCSVTCGNGTLTRVRRCSTGHAEDCTGNSSEVIDCQKSPCKVNGVWSSWSPWSQCDVTCENGHIYRTRTCSNPAPAFGGLNCSGDSQEASTCSLAGCPVDGSWSLWSPWSQCDVTCEDGHIHRTRTCTNPAPAFGGLNCSGASQEINTCKLSKCPSWSEWFLGDCSVTCGDGTQSRIRLCSSGHDEDCPGSPLDTVPCSQAPC